MRIVQFSGGKNSTAMLLMMIERKIPFDEVRHFDHGPWNYPGVADHVSKVEELIGMPIKRYYHRQPIDYLFYEYKRKNPPGRQGLSFPTRKYRWCQSRMADALSKGARGKNNLIFMGYHAEEWNRWSEHSARGGKICAPLISWGLSDSDCLNYCYERGLDFSGIYRIFRRLSCWCCPLQPLSELRKLRIYYPDLWARLLEMQSRTWRRFKEKKSVQDLELQFAREDAELARVKRRNANLMGVY